MKRLALLSILLLVVASLFTSCAEPKTIEINKKQVVVQPYGLANEQAVKNDSVVYQMSSGSVICAIIFCETVIAPIYIVGWDLYEPVRKK